MSTQEFTFVLDHPLTDDEVDTLFEEGCDDATPEVAATRTLLHFNREASSLAEALVTALYDVERASLTVAAVESNDLVTVKDIAARTGRTYESVRLLTIGKRGPGGFPPPLSSGGWQLYSWTQVDTWFGHHFPGATAEYAWPTTDYDRIIAAADHLVRARAILGRDRAGTLARLVA